MKPRKPRLAEAENDLVAISQKLSEVASLTADLFNRLQALDRRFQALDMAYRQEEAERRQFGWVR